jgi:hypothetical protein
MSCCSSITDRHSDGSENYQCYYGWLSSGGEGRTIGYYPLSYESEAFESKRALTYGCLQKKTRHGRGARYDSRALGSLVDSTTCNPKCTNHFVTQKKNGGTKASDRSVWRRDSVSCRV